MVRTCGKCGAHGSYGVFDEEYGWLCLSCAGYYDDGEFFDEEE